MTNEQKTCALQCARRIHAHLQLIAAGQDYLCPDLHLDLDQRRQWADWEMTFLLKELMGALPCDLRAAVQSCLNINDQIWSKEYREAYYAEHQKETSPSSLPASDSF